MIFVTMGVITSWIIGFALSIYLEVPPIVEEKHEYIQRVIDEKI